MNPTATSTASTRLVLHGIGGLLDRVGSDLGTSDWYTIEQEAVTTFAELTGDRQWIHLDQERARAGPFRGTIQHGFLTLGLATALLDQVLSVQDVSAVLNYGLDRVRFPAPLRVGSRVRMAVHLATARRLEGAAEVVFHLTYEVEDQAKPCCVADVVFRYYS